MSAKTDKNESLSRKDSYVFVLIKQNNIPMSQAIVHIRENTDTIGINCSIYWSLAGENVEQLFIICHSETTTSPLQIVIRDSTKIREIFLIANVSGVDDRNCVINFKSIRLDNLPNLYQFVVDHTCDFKVDKLIIENIRNSIGFWSNSLSAKSCVLKNTSGNFNISATDIDISDSAIMYLKIRSAKNLNATRSDIKSIEIVDSKNLNMVGLSKIDSIRTIRSTIKLDKIFEQYSDVLEKNIFYMSRNYLF